MPTRSKISKPDAAKLPSFTSKYVQAAHQYALDVVSGRIITCKYVRLACERHIEDLRGSETRHFAYRFDELKAHRAAFFMSHLPHVRGEWARPVRGIVPRIRFEPWQLFGICSIFGWVSKDSGLRRYIRVYEEDARKNAKSTKAAAIGEYMFCADGEQAAEVFVGATKEKQAMEVFGTARQMARILADLRKTYEIEVNKKSLTRPDGSRFEPLVRNPGDGSSPSCAIIDEYHEHENAVLWDAMLTGMGARSQPLHYTITTAGFNIGGPCYALRGDAIKVLEGNVKDERFFAIIYTLDEGDDWRNPEVWIKANPNLGVSVDRGFLADQVKAAINYPQKRGSILTKHFNIWSNASKPWMPMERWDACCDPKLKIEDYAGTTCFMGNDLGSRIDLASRALLFKQLEADGQEHYYYFGQHYAPEMTIHDGDHEVYAGWVEEGHLTLCDGHEISLSQVENDIREDARLFPMESIAFDPWQAKQMQERLMQEFGEDVAVTVPQTTQYFSDPMKELQAAVFSKRFHHNGDPVMRWAMSNVEVREHPVNETIFPRKPQSEKLKIDPVAALITAMNRAYTATAEQYTSTYVGSL